MKAITRSGTVYDVKFRNTLGLMELFHIEHDDDTMKEWFFFGALINISGEWHHCSFEKKYIDDKLTPFVGLSDSAKKALNLDTSKPVFIRLDSIPEEEFEIFYKDLIQSIKEKANALEFTYIDITSYITMPHNYICGSDCKDDSRYLHFNDKALKILDAFNALDDFDDRMNFTSKFEGHDTTYRIDGTNIDKLFELAGPKLKEIEAKREERRRKEEKIRRVKEAIKNGAISFYCESVPHNEDLSDVILTRPCPNSGSFILTHRIPAEVFSKIKKFGVYYDNDFLEECDMFWSAPGWRFGKEAIETLLRDNFKVFVDYEEVSLTEDSETKKPRPKPEGIGIENGGDNDPLKGVDFK